MSQPDLVLAIDQGTTNTKALLVDAAGRILQQASVPNAVSYPQSGWAEQSATALLDGVRQVIAAIVSQADAQDIAAIAISNQRESIIVWDAATGEPIGPCIIWQCRRSAATCEALRAAGHAGIIEQKTGLALDPLFPAGKIAWLLDAAPRLPRPSRRSGNPMAWRQAGATAAHRTGQPIRRPRPWFGC